MTDFRELCTELLEDAIELADLMQGVLDGDYTPDCLTLQPIKGSIKRARLALAQPEPLADGEVVELVAWLRANADYSLQKAATATFKRFHRVADLLERLAQPEPQGPTNAQIDELAAEYLDGDRASVRDFARAALARWGRPAIEPVPVAERLPGLEDCDGEGKCWWGIPQTNITQMHWIYRKKKRWDDGATTHWLPHHVLPVPQQENKQ